MTTVHASSVSNVRSAGGGESQPCLRDWRTTAPDPHWKTRIQVQYPTRHTCIRMTGSAHPAAAFGRVITEPSTLWRIRVMKRPYAYTRGKARDTRDEKSCLLR